MRLASYNIEWMGRLFDEDRLQSDDEYSGRYNVSRAEQASAIADVLRLVDADLFVILEAPNSPGQGRAHKALESFARHFGLRQSRAFSGFSSGSDQEIALLFDPDIVSARFSPLSHKTAPRFDKHFTVKSEDKRREYRFSKPPLEAEITMKRGGRFRLIGVHLKTKAPHGAKDKADAIRIGFENRHKQIAQAKWLRARAKHIRGPLIIAGDFNDGPGYDDFERAIGESSVDILSEAGLVYDPALFGGERLSTARFASREDQSFREVLLDFIFVNSRARPLAEAWKIWHPLHDPWLSGHPKWRDALLRASDHFPVSLDLRPELTP